MADFVGMGYVYEQPSSMIKLAVRMFLKLLPVPLLFNRQHATVTGLANRQGNQGTTRRYP
jgi:hypothetical protein